jgi:acyl-CoA synthetase (AMP-forming)/AMP-acid ligase II
MSNAHMYFFAEVTRCMVRFEAEDTYLAQLPLFHGNATYMAIYPAMIAGGRAVLRSKFSASRWADQLREHDVTVTNFLGVMMDFVWKQPPRENDAVNKLRAVFAAPTASSIVDEFRGRFGEIWQWCTGRVPAFAVPRFVRFVSKLPRTPSAKIRRNVLRDEAPTAADVFDRTGGRPA